MTALALRLPATPRLSWPRIGAMSGAMSLHLSLALLLMPPVALQLVRRAQQEPIVVRVVDAPPKPVEIKDLQPPQHKPRPTPPLRTVQRQQTQVETPATPTESTMSYPASRDEGPPDIAPAQDVAPTALGYGNVTRVKYPLEALRRREHGTVILRVLVGADGVPQQIDIETSSGSPRLDGAARDAVRHWTFRPGTRNGVAQSAWARVPIAFDLTQL